MQMLCGGGVRCHGLYPAFEPEDLAPGSCPEFRPGWAYKVVMPSMLDLSNLKAGFVLLLPTRRARDMADSFSKLMQCGRLMKRDADRLAHSEDGAIQRLRRIAGKVLTLKFADTICKPQQQAERLATVLPDSFDVDGAAAEVRRRTPGVYSGLLELEEWPEIAGDPALVRVAQAYKYAITQKMEVA